MVRFLINWVTAQLLIWWYNHIHETVWGKEARLGFRRTLSRALYCMAVGITIFGKNAGKRYVEIKGIRVFDEVKDGNFLNILKRLKKGKYNKLVARVDKLTDEIGDEGMQMLSDLKYLTKFHRKNIDLIDNDGKVVFRGNPEEMVFFLANKTDSEKVLSKLFKAVLKAKPHFNPDTPKLVSEGFTGARRLIPSKNKLCPDFKDMATLEYKGKKLVYKGDSRFAEVKIKLTGSRAKDFRYANEQVAAMLGQKKFRTPRRYTWHHMDDFDPLTGECTMQLVLTSVHDMASHTGSASLWQTLFEIVYKS